MESNLSENFYDILNIHKDASVDEIKKAYRDLAKQYHPDKNNTPGAAEKFKMISKAYQVLSDPLQRRCYDNARRNGGDFNGHDDARPNFSGEYFKNMFRNWFPDYDDDDGIFRKHDSFSNHMRKSQTKNFTASERSREQNATRSEEFDSWRFSGFGADKPKRKADFDDGYFTNEPTSFSTKRPRQENFSRPASSSTTSSEQTQDPAIERDLELTLDEIAKGCTKKLKIKRTIHDERGGRAEEAKVIKIDVKPGWKAGTKVTFQEHGDKFPGRTAADITFIVKDKPHALFTRDSDNNLLHTANISLKRALLGVSYCIQGINGVRHDINVRDIVHPGFVKRYPGEGLPLPKTPSKRGDLIVTFNIQFPTFLSWDQRRVLSECLPS